MLTEPRQFNSIELFRHVTETQWNDWRWQFKNRITSLHQLKQVIEVTEDEEKALLTTSHIFRFAITPHYATLIDPKDPQCPIRRQVLPRTAELTISPEEFADPLAEDAHSPAPNITHRYPDRVLFLLTHECSLYCRYCTRRRIVGDQEVPSNADLDAGVAYIREHQEIRDVLISGGDPLAVSDSRLEYLLSRLTAIPHVEIVRIGTRMPVVTPQRITDELLHLLKRFQPVWLNTHFNHPLELAPSATRLCMERIADAGIPAGNQSVLLKGINDCPVIFKKLVHELLKVRCRPYYIYNCDLSQGLREFRTTVETGVAIIEALQGHTTGFAVPLFVIDLPGGGGKVPVMPNYFVSQVGDKITLRNFTGATFEHVDVMEAKQSRVILCGLCNSDHNSIEFGPAAERWQILNSLSSIPVD